MNARVYWVLVLVVFFVQVFVLNNLSVTPLVAPMVYILPLLLLPIESPQWKVLLAGLITGVVVDLTMGTIGLNTMITLPVAMARRPLLYALGGLSPMSNESGVPSVKRMGIHFHRYIISVVIIHSILFYFAEWLSFDNFGTLMLRILCSTLCSLLLDYIIIMLFIKRLSA
ncbi:MAG: hypothetical protein IKL20_07020 [Alistipes sp.]|nr:hypothetical protein [Alistipes sp.]